MGRIRALAVLAVLTVAVGCGGGKMGQTQTNGQPLDPQGNWLFTLTDSSQTWSFAGQLYELAPPTVTVPNGLWAFGSCNAGVGGQDNLFLSAPAQVTGTNSITFNFVSDPQATQTANYALAGTIADDQQHMSGTYTGSSPCGLTTPSGTWTAQLIPAVTGTWTGSAQGVAVSAVITENTDQTSTQMGYLSGSLDITGSPCIADGTYTLDSPISTHAAETAVIAVDDGNGITLTGVFNVDPASPNAATGNVFYAGGSCDGQSFPFTLTRN